MKSFSRFLQESAPRASSADIKRLAPKIAQAAQKVYDAWDEDEDEYAGGGICHLIADEVADVLMKAHIECATVSNQIGEQHVWVVAQVKDGVFAVDIPPHVYERGGGYTWTKIKGVRISARDVSIDRVDANPDKFSQYIDESVQLSESATVELYHGTSAARAAKIAKDGFKTYVHKQTMGGDPESSRKYIWFARNRRDAVLYAEQHSNPVVITVRFPAEYLKALDPYGRNSGPVSVWIPDNVPAKYIVNIEKVQRV